MSRQPLSPLDFWLSIILHVAATVAMVCYLIVILFMVGGAV